MICTKCKKTIEDDSVYCRFCGRKQIREKTSRKRSNGEGSVYMRENGTWVACKTYFVENADGTKTRKRVTRSGFKSEAQARKFLPLLGTEHDERKHIRAARPRTMTLEKLVGLWRDDYCRKKIAEDKGDGWKSTLTCYTSALKIFGDYMGEAIADIDIDDLQDALSSSGKGKRTRQNAKIAIGLVYKFGIPRKMIPGGIDLGQYLYVGAGQQTTRDHITADELARIEAAIGVVPYAEVVLCHCYLGFRPSAFIDLRIEDYNKAEGYVRGGIKTEAGKNRIVTISPKIAEYISQAVGSRESGFIFQMSNGKSFSIKDYRAAFYDVIAACGIDNPIVPETGAHRLSPHSCRHTFITMAKAIAAPDKDKMALAGHTQLATHQHYQHVSVEDLRKITDMIYPQ